MCHLSGTVDVGDYDIQRHSLFRSEHECVDASSIINLQAEATCHLSPIRKLAADAT